MYQERSTKHDDKPINRKEPKNGWSINIYQVFKLEREPQITKNSNSKKFCHANGFLPAEVPNQIYCRQKSTQEYVGLCNENSIPQYDCDRPVKVLNLEEFIDP